jgi:hypothetical protein
LGYPTPVDLSDSNLINTWFEIRQSQHTPILFLGQQSKRLGLVTRGDYAFEKMSTDRFGRRYSDNLGKGDYATES